MFNLICELFKWISLSFQCPFNISIYFEMILNCTFEINIINTNFTTTKTATTTKCRWGDKAAVVLFAVASKLNTEIANILTRWFEGETESGWFLMRFSFFFSFCRKMHPYSLYGSKLYQCLVRDPQFIGIICMLTICCINGKYFDIYWFNIK